MSRALLKSYGSRLEAVFHLPGDQRGVWGKRMPSVTVFTTGVAMDACSAFQDFFRTYVSLSDWIKALWLTVPPTFVLGFAWIVVNRPARR